MATRSWAPSDYPAGVLAQWIDPSQPNNVTAQNNFISKISDSGSNSFNEYQTNPAAQPTYVTGSAGINGISAIQAIPPGTFYFDTQMPSNPAVRTYIAVIQTNGGDTRTVFGSSATGGLQARVESDGSLGLVKQFVVNIAQSDSGASKVQNGIPCIAAWSFRQSDGTYLLRLNGSTIGSGVIGPTTLDSGRALLGANGSDYSREFFNGLIGEHDAINSIALSDIQLSEGDFAWKWGLQGYLPADHSYASAAPTVTTADPAVSASLATTEAPDTAFASAAVSTSAAFAATESPDTAAVSASISTSASLAVTEQPDTASIAAQTSTAASLSATERPDSAAATATTSTTANLAATEQPDTAALSASVGTSAQFAATEAPDTASVTAFAATMAVLAASDPIDVAEITATATAGAPVAANLAATEAPDTAAIALHIYPLPDFVLTGRFPDAITLTGVFPPDIALTGRVPH